MFKKLAQKLIIERQKRSVTDSITSDFDLRKKIFLNKMTHNALKMYERNMDIKNFTKLVLSDSENTSHNRMVDALIENGVIDPFEDDKLKHLSDNSKFLRDLGLLDE